MRRYRDCLYQHLSQVTTLVTGPSGSGKELVSRAIGLSGYIPFDRASVEFRSDFVSSYRAVNIAAFSSSLVESELFGHAKGAFTGAVSSRAGWLEVCGKDGSILLDEIGELEMPTQVKLLRVLQNREFQRSGESKTRKFEGKLIAATNRDLKEEIAKHHFREDLYYRLCADVIETPSLHAQVKDNPDVFENLVGFIVQRMVPEVQEELTSEIVHWLERNLPADYTWPGNFRELEQCVRNLMIHGDYHFKTDNEAKTPASGESSHKANPEITKLMQQISNLELTADELTSAYCRIAYKQTRSFEKAAKLLQLDRRTVRRKSDTTD
jgi:DNA-binding NtrC family response regulator